MSKTERSRHLPGVLCWEAAPAPPRRRRPRRPDEVKALRAEVKRLAEEVEALKSRGPAARSHHAPRAAPTPDAVAELADRVGLVEIQQRDAVVAGDVPGSFRVPGTELSLRLYGFAELYWVHAFGPDSSDIDYSTFPPYLPLTGRRRAGARTATTSPRAPRGSGSRPPRRPATASSASRSRVTSTTSPAPATARSTARRSTPLHPAVDEQLRVPHPPRCTAPSAACWSARPGPPSWTWTTTPRRSTTTARPARPSSASRSSATPTETRSSGSFTVALENPSSYVLDSRADSPATEPGFGLPMLHEPLARPGRGGPLGQGVRVGRAQRPRDDPGAPLRRRRRHARPRRAASARRRARPSRCAAPTGWRCR